MAGKKAFDAPRSNTFSFDPDELIIVGGDGPADDPVPDDGTDAQLAELYDPDVHLELEPGMAENVDHFGIILPVVIVKIAGKPYVVDGRTRVRAARAAKQLQAARGEQTTIMVPCVTRSPGGPGRLLATMTTANEARRTTTVLSKIAKLERLRERGATDEDLAVIFKVSPKTIENWTALAGASRVVKDAVEAGKISASAGVKIAEIEGVELQKAAISALLAAGGSARTARKVAVRAKGKTSEDGGDGLGTASRRAQRKLFEYAKGSDGDDTDAYWDGVHDALAIILGQRPFKNTKKAKAAMKAAKVEG